jgi:hypothetical protein
MRLSKIRRVLENIKCENCDNDYNFDIKIIDDVIMIKCERCSHWKHFDSDGNDITPKVNDEVVIFDCYGEKNAIGKIIDDSNLNQLKIQSGVATFFESPFGIKKYEPKFDWVIFEGGNWYYSDKFENRRNCEDFADAKIFKNITKDEMYKIGEELFKGCRCIWIVLEYERALREYEARVYVTIAGIKYKWGRFTDIQEALRMAQEGYKVAYNYNDKYEFILDGKIGSLDPDIIINAKWRIILDNE